MTRIKHLENKGFFIFDDDEKETLAELTYKKNGDILIFDHTYVSDKLRNQGIAGKLLNTAVIYARENKLGKKLVLEILGHAKKAGYKEMVLDTIIPLQSAIHLYKKVGFVECEAYYHNPMDDVLYFKKIL